MTESTRDYELILLGATGYTGKLVAEWVTAHLPQDLKWAIAGRNAKKLEAVKDELLRQSPSRKPPAIETVDLNPTQLTTLTQRTTLLITTIGPYMFHGEPILRACAHNGTHYLDCTGETPWHRDMISKYDATAQRTGAIIIPQCGLDSVLADMLAFAVTSHIRKTLHAPTLSVTMTLYDFKLGMSGGTASTMVEMFGHYPLKKIAEDMKPFALSPAKPSALSKSPTSPLWYRLLGLLTIPQLGGVQTVGPMASIDVSQVHRSWGLYESWAKKNMRPDMAYGPNFRFTEYMKAKNAVAGALVSLGFGLFGLLMAFPLSRAVLTPLLKKFVIPAPGEGPSKEQMKGDFVDYRALGVADTPKKEEFMGRLGCAHGGYQITGLTLSAAADVILRGNLKATEAGKIGGGILTPATLGEEYLNKLREFGMKIQVD